MNCKFCGAVGRCSLALIKGNWGELVNTARVVNLHKGQLVYREGFPADGVFLLSRGSIKLTTFSESGMERILDFVTCGELFGLDALLQEGIRFQTAEARESSQGSFLGLDQFRNTLQSTPDLLWHVTLMLNDMLHRANQGRLAISGARVRERIEHALSDLSQRLVQLRGARKPAFAKLKQRELADLLGVSEETICRELRLLKDDLKNELLWVRASAGQAGRQSLARTG